MSKQTITIPVFRHTEDAKLEHEQVEADVVDGFAIHPAYIIGGFSTIAWTITHVKSGLACGQNYATKAAAIRRRNVFRKMEVGGVRFGDMEACEAINLFPVLLEQWVALTRQSELEPEEVERAIDNRDFLAGILCTVGVEA